MSIAGRVSWYWRARSRARRFGVPFVRRKTFTLPPAITVGRRRIAIDPRAEHGHLSDFVAVFLDDAYRLETVAAHDPAIRSIVDVGANVGWFARAARSYFPEAAISVYEPNPQIRDRLGRHVASIGATVCAVAVGGRRDRVRLVLPRNADRDPALAGLSRAEPGARPGLGHLARRPWRVP